MRSLNEIRDPTGEASPGLLGVIAAFGEEVAAEPENLEGALRRLAAGLREALGLTAVAFSISSAEGRKVFASGDDVTGGVTTEFPIARGKIPVGTLRGYATKRGGDPGAAAREALRAAAGAAALALDAAHARELAARRAAQGSVVQIASEALGAIVEEEQLYRTVLVLTLELLGASGGAILLDDGSAVSLGLEGDQHRLAALREEMALRDGSPRMGRLAGCHTLGVWFEGGAVFLLRPERPYTETEGVSLKLVARQLARARERSRLHSSLEKTNLEAISALAAALESRDDTTGEHIRRTQTLADQVARRLRLTSEEVRTVRYAAVLHDIGKIGIPDAILNKPGRLTEGEWDLMRRHPRIGYEIVGRIEGFEEVACVILAHHERHDGLGYPLGLAGHDIPTSARLISAIDAYDAMTNDRPYRAALSHADAVAELEKNSGTQFDPDVVEALRDALFEREEAEL